MATEAEDNDASLGLSLEWTPSLACFLSGRRWPLTLCFSGDILQANDDLSRVINSYEKIVEGRPINGDSEEPRSAAPDNNSGQCYIILLCYYWVLVCFVTFSLILLLLSTARDHRHTDWPGWTGHSQPTSACSPSFPAIKPRLCLPLAIPHPSSASSSQTSGRLPGQSEQQPQSRRPHQGLRLAVSPGWWAAVFRWNSTGPTQHESLFIIIPHTFHDLVVGFYWRQLESIINSF